MTASAQRRRWSTQLAAVVALVALVVAGATVAVAVSTLRSSEEGTAPVVDARPTVSFPATPNAVVAVVDDFDRLTSLALLTLAPSGVGGSIAVLPVNADQTNGFGPERLPLSRRAYVPGEDADAADLIGEIEAMLSLTVQRAAVLGPDELADKLEPFGRLQVDLPQTVIDTDTPGTGAVAAAGPRVFASDQSVAAFTAIDTSEASYDHHEIDVALWSALAAAAGGGGFGDVEPDTDEFDRPVAPETFDELWARLFSGAVGARDVAIDPSATRAADNESGADFVLIDRRDALLVFGSASPGLVSSPTEAPSFQLIVKFDEAQMAPLTEDAAGQPITKTSMTRRFMGELLFKQGNIVAVDLGNDPAGVPAVTRVEIADAALEAEIVAVSERFFGDAEFVVADVLTDGVDAVVTLGSDFIDQRLELIEIERRDAAAAEATQDDGADFDVSGDAVPDDGAGSDDGEDDGEPNEASETTSDTVLDDE